MEFRPHILPVNKQLQRKNTVSATHNTVTVLLLQERPEKTYLYARVSSNCTTMTQKKPNFRNINHLYGHRSQILGIENN